MSAYKRYVYIYISINNHHHIIGGEHVSKIKTKTILSLMVFIFAITICGSVSATETYNIGEIVTENAMTDPNLGFSNADEVLCLSNGGSSHYQNMTTEDSIQAVIDTTSNSPSQQKISQGKGNLITISDPQGDLSFTFVTKKGNQLMAKKYTVTSDGSSMTIKNSNTVDISSYITTSQWNTVKTQLGPNAYELTSIAQAWAAGAPSDLLRIAGSSGGISQGLLSGYVMAKSINQNYPLNTADESYHIITTPGGGDDNVPQYLLELTPLKWVRDSGKVSYFNYLAMDNGNPNQAAYIWWNRATQNGVLVLMSSTQTLRSQFTAETGVSVVSGSISEIQFNNWLLNKMENSPAILITVDGLKKLNKENFDYLWAHGIDTDYINNLNDETTAYAIGNVLSSNDYQNMYNLGEQAAILAQNALKFHKGDSNVALISSAGYVLLNGISTQGALDGVISITGTTLGNLMNLKRAIWQPLWFTFIEKEASGQLNAVIVNYVNGALVISPVYDISADALKDDAYAKTVSAAFSGGAADKPYFQQDYYIVSLANQWAVGAPYDFQISGIGGGCPGSGLSQGYLISNYILTNYPLGAGQQYITISIPAHCKEQVIMDSLGVSAALGSYYTMGLSSYAANANLAGLFIIWSESTQSGQAILLNMDRNIINTMQNQDVGTNNYYYKTMYWALWYLEKAFPGQSRYTEAVSAFSVLKEISITENELKTMLAAGGDPVKYIMEYVAPVTPPTDPNTDPTNPGTDPSPDTTTDPVVPGENNQATGNDGGIISTISAAVSPVSQSGSNNEIAAGLPLQSKSASNSSNLNMVAIITLILLVVLVGGLYLGRNNIIAAFRKSEKLGK